MSGARPSQLTVFITLCLLRNVIIAWKEFRAEHLAISALVAETKVYRRVHRHPVIASA